MRRQDADEQPFRLNDLGIDAQVWLPVVSRMFPAQSAASAAASSELPAHVTASPPIPRACPPRA